MTLVKMRKAKQTPMHRRKSSTSSPKRRSSVLPQQTRTAVVFDQSLEIPSGCQCRRDLKRDYDRRTPLHLACASGNHGAVEVLLHEDVINMDCRDNFGRTPLMEAVRHGNESCARKLMHRGAHHGFCVDGETDDANATHAGQELCGTVKCQAAFSGQNKYLNNLISLCGLSPDCCDYDKRTALMLACAEGNMDAAVTLVQVHADPYLKDRWGHTALMEAKDNGHYDLVQVMERIWKSHQKRKKEKEKAEKDLFPC